MYICKELEIFFKAPEFIAWLSYSNLAGSVIFSICLARRLLTRDCISRHFLFLVTSWKKKTPCSCGTSLRNRWNITRPTVLYLCHSSMTTFHSRCRLTQSIRYIQPSSWRCAKLPSQPIISTLTIGTLASELPSISKYFFARSSSLE